MIIRILKEMAECPYCHKSFNFEDECNEHIKDYHVDFALNKNVVFFKCEVCDNDYENKEDAMKCDQSHKDGTDYKWQEELQN